MPAPHTPIRMEICTVAWGSLEKSDRERIAAARKRLAAHVGKRIHETVNGGGER